MFNQFGATAETLSKASTMVLRFGTDAHLYDDPEDVSIAPLLDSRFDSEKIEALKRLLALIAQGFDVSNFFPQVVKNVASQSLEVKKLVYLYLLHYAEKRPNEALLSINYFQKDLGDPNPLVRAWALRTMAGIRLYIIAPLVLSAVGKCARDPSVYVRKCAANALPKLHDLHLDEHTSAIEELVGILLNDRSPGVVGAAAAAFASICPNNFTMIGRIYRKLCEILPDVEEWGQIVLIGILLRYATARHGLVQESVMFPSRSKESYSSGKDDLEADFGLDKEAGGMQLSFDTKFANTIFKCYVEGPDEYLSRSSYADNVSSEFDCEGFTTVSNNDDIKVLLQCTSPLLWSTNSAVVLAAAGVHWIMAPREDIKRIVKPLLFLLRSSNASKYVVLCNIHVFAKGMPSLFAPHFEDFFVCSSDAYQVKALKLEILSSIATNSSISSIFGEFEDYIRDPDRRFAADTVAAIGLRANRLPKIPSTCLDGLLALTRQEIFTTEFGSTDGEASVLIQAILSIQTVISKDPLSHEKVIIQLIRSLDSIKVPAARAIIIWMVGTYSSLGRIIPRMLTTVLKYLAWSFKSEGLETKLQTLNTTAKVLSGAEGEDLSTFKKIFSYVVELAECDLSYDVRDRARFLKKLLSCKLDSQVPEEELSTLSEENFTLHTVVEHVFGKKLKPISPETMNHRFYLPGSLSQIVLHAAPGYEPLPKPCSFVFEEHGELSDVNRQRDRAADSDFDATDDPQTFSQSMDEDDSSDYSSRSSITGSSGHDGSGSSDENGLTNKEKNGNADPLIQISDVADASKDQSGASVSGSAGVEELVSKRALDIWLDEQPHSSNQTSSRIALDHSSSARISIGDIGSRVKPKSYSLLDPANGDGLKVEYSFSSEISDISPPLVCVEVLFENCSSEPILEINLEYEESNKASDSINQASTRSESLSHTDVPTLVPIEEIDRLETGQRAKRIIQVHFYHHLLPLKLTLHYNGKKVPVKLRPDIGYFVKPLPMNDEGFSDSESRLPGMFEYSRRCMFKDHIGDPQQETVDCSLTKDKFLVICESIALKMLSNANLFLVSVNLPVGNSLDDVSGLRLRFSSEVLRNGFPCLVTITVEGRCSEALNLTIKVNCEETVFGLNLLNRIANFLVESSSSNL